MNEKRSRFRQIEMKTYQKDRVSTIKDFEIMEKIGDGAYSHVFRASFSSDLLSGENAGWGWKRKTRNRIST